MRDDSWRARRQPSRVVRLRPDVGRRVRRRFSCNVLHCLGFALGGRSKADGLPHEHGAAIVGARVRPPLAPVVKAPSAFSTARGAGGGVEVAPTIDRKRS